MGTYAKIAAYSGLLCAVCRKSAYFAKIFARLRKLYYISPRKDETTTTKNKNTMKNGTKFIKHNGKRLTKFDIAYMVDRFDVHAHATILINEYSYIPYRVSPIAQRRATA